MKAVQAYSRRRRVSLGKAASELIRRGACYQVPIRMVNRLPVLDAPEGFPAITSAQVRKIQDEE